MKKKIEIVTKYFLSVLTGLVIVSIFFALYGLFQVAVLDKSYASYFGYSLFEVESGSMSPTINVKDMVVVKETNDIKKNDIITYNIDGSFITHRAVDVQKNKIIAKGDFNNYEDKTIPRDTVIGKVVKVFPKFGVWKKIMLSPLVLIAVFFTMLLFGLGLSYEDKKNADKRGLFRKRKQEEFDDKSKTLFEKIKEHVFLYKKKEITDEVTDEKEENEVEEEVSESVDKALSRETVDIHVKTDWSDNDNQDGIRPNSITIKVMNGDSVVELKEITEKDNWSYTFKGLCKYEDNYEGDSDHIIKYSIDEVLISGYKKTIAGFNVTNTHASKKTNISGRIIWDDNENIDSRPEAVNVKLMKNGVLVESKKVTKNNDWKYTFINLYKFEKGVEAKYSIEEELVSGYTSNVSGYDVINVRTSNNKKNTSSTKQG